MATISNIAMYVSIGETYIIEVPVIRDLASGFNPRTEPMTINGKPITFQNGFYIEDEIVGAITHVYTDKVAIDYKHLLPGENSLWFYAKTGEIIKYYVAHTQVHDHATIVTGGPAYGTYYSPPQLPTAGEN